MKQLLIFAALLHIAICDIRAQTCQPIVWDQPPELSGTKLSAALSMTCEFAPVRGGSLEDLYEAQIKAVVDRADEIHSGPSPITGGVKFDVTTALERSGAPVTIRGFVTLVRDKNHLAQAVVSTSVSASGPAKNLEKLKAASDIWAGTGSYRVVFRSELTVAKPPAVKKDRLIQTVKRQCEAEMGKTSKEQIKNYQDVL